jgi:hypothetical protein
MIEIREFVTWGENEALRVRKWVPLDEYAQEIAALRNDLTACQLERSEAYDLRDAAEGRYCTALVEIERLRDRVKLVADDIGVYFARGESPEPYLVLLCSDTFAYATADAEPVPDDQIAIVRRLYADYGDAGLIAWASWHRGCEPLQQHRTETYQMARASLPQSDAQNT